MDKGPQDERFGGIGESRDGKSLNFYESGDDPTYEITVVHDDGTTSVSAIDARKRNSFAKAVAAAEAKKSGKAP